MNKAVMATLALLVSVSLLGCTGTKQPEAPPKGDTGKVEAPQQPQQPQPQQPQQPQQPAAGTIVYQNAEYGFTFTLPASWQGYKIITDKWEGFALDAAGKQVPGETGPLLSIRHPQWTQEKPRQDIPIMVFTTDQWNSLQADKFHIGAAPINPSELGRNAKYVFALPARYNYAFPEGYQEVEQILAGHPLQASK